MKKGQSSRTAAGAAALRANHFQNSVDPVFADPYAYDLTSHGWQKLLSSPQLLKLMNSAAFNRTLGLLTGQVVGRSRYAEDLLQHALSDHMHQYVLVGAGLDSFALRQSNRYPNLKIFEIDHPDTQAAKRHKLKQLGPVPTNVEFVAIDFEKESLADALARSSYDQTTASFFSWLGTTHYLEPQTTLNTLKNIAAFAAPLSEVVLDYSTDYRELQGFERLGSFALSQFTKFLKEPLIGTFKPAELHSAVAKLGFEVIEDLSGNAMSKRYFSQRPDHIRHTSATRLLHLRLREE